MAHSTAKSAATSCKDTRASRGSLVRYFALTAICGHDADTNDAAIVELNYPYLRMCSDRRDGLPSIPCIGIRPADPIQRGIVGFCGGEHRGDTRDGIGKIIVCARRVIDAVSASARHPPLQADDLGDEPIMARQGDVASVEQRQHVPEQIGLGLLAEFIADAVPAERFLNELAAVVIANNLADAIALSSVAKSSTTADGENGGRTSRTASTITASFRSSSPP